jgi:DNA mismatch endonuclease (patch repair protein)
MVPDRHTPEQRRYNMSRVKGKDTSIELIIRNELEKRGLKFETYANDLPGKPDILFREKKVIIFIDGDFWHGYRFPRWKMNIPQFWQEKIGKTRIRDKKNFMNLRKNGWKVIRIWQHEIEKDLNVPMNRVLKILNIG